MILAARRLMRDRLGSVAEAHEPGGDAAGLVRRLNGVLKPAAEAESSGVKPSRRG